MAAMLPELFFSSSGPLALLLAFWLACSGYKGFSEEDKRLTAIPRYPGVAVIVQLGITGPCIGIRGIEVAGKSKETAVLDSSQVAFNAHSALFWIGVGVARHSHAWRFVE